MKIALLAHSHYPIAQPFAGGLETHTAMVADGLVARGHDVTLFAKQRSRTRATLKPVVDAAFRFGQMTDADGVDHSQELLDAATRVAIRAVVNGGFDVTLNNSLERQPYLLLQDRPMFTVLHTPATLELVNEVLEAPGWSAGERHLFAGVSENTTRDWARLLGDVRCIPNGIDLRHWAPRGRIRPRPGLAVWAARITPEKGLPLAIKAATDAGFRLAISGPISDRPYFTREIAPLLSDRVRYLGHLDHGSLPGFLQRGSVFLATPRWDEPFGLAMVEAMAAGTPVAVLPRGAAAEIVSPAGGVLALDDTSGALAAALLQAVQLDRTEVRRSVAGFDSEIMLDAYEAVLTDLATGTGSGAGTLAERPGHPRDL